MSDLFKFMGENPFLTWFLAWGLWPICQALKAIICAPFRYPYLAYKARLRTQNIKSHGWPQNPLMDADGDIIHPPQETPHAG